MDHNVSRLIEVGDRTLFSRLTSSSNSRGLIVQNTVEQGEYRKRALAIQRELRAVAVSLSANRRRFLKKRAELIRQSALFSGESTSTMTEKRKSEDDRGNVSVRALSAVVERPYDEDTEQNVDRELGVSRRLEVTEFGKDEVSRDGTFKRRSKQNKKHMQDVSANTGNETVQETANQLYSGIYRKNSFSKYIRDDVSETSTRAVQESTEPHSRRYRNNSYPWVDTETQFKFSQDDIDMETALPCDSVKVVKRKKSSVRSPRSAGADGATVTIAPTLKSMQDDTPRNDSTVISRRMRSMTVGATEHLDMYRLRQVYNIRIGAHSPSQEQEYMENTQQRIKDFLERASAESVVSDSSDLASESGSAIWMRRPSDRRRSVSRVYALEPSPRLRKRSVPAKLTGAISEEEESFKDQLRLPPLSLPPVRSNVPTKLKPKNYSKRGHHNHESTHILTTEEWEDLKHCRYLRTKSI